MEMTHAEMQEEAVDMAEIYVALGTAFQTRQVNVSEETLKSLTATMYIQASKPAKKAYSGGGGYSGGFNDAPPVPMPPGTVLGNCNKCGSENGWSKKGKIYCKALCFKN